VGVAALLAARFARTHQWLLEALEPLVDDVLRERPGASAPSIAFHAWHVARWADRVQARLAGTTELWERDALARRWGLADGALGRHATGMGLADDEYDALRLPGKDELLRYVRAVFTAADQAAAAIADADLETLIVDHYDKESPKAQVLIAHTGHASRHLGMIEALRGVRGERGSATG
jgi:hypothetical protein